jgi:hypothetical protein
MKHDTPGLDDPIWIYVLETRLRPYIDAVRKWWSEVDTISPYAPGIYELTGPPGLYYRFARTAKRSPISGVQAFPFVNAAYLQISGVQGGSTKLVTRLCNAGRFKIDEFTVIARALLPSTLNQGQFLAIVPTEIYEDPELKTGRWVYMSNYDIQCLSKGTMSMVLKERLATIT